MLINYNMKVLTGIFSNFQGAAGMLGSADLVKLCCLGIMNTILFLHKISGIFSDFYFVV